MSFACCFQDWAWTLPSPLKVQQTASRLMIELKEEHTLRSFVMIHDPFLMGPDLSYIH
jgi:hypothetical protein